MLSSDYQEAKNVDTVGANIMPNTRRATATVRVVAGAALDWLLPAPHACVARRQRLVVAASGVHSVVFRVDDGGPVRARGSLGIWSAVVSLTHGWHELRAAGGGAAVTRTVRVCSP
jgi:hypothetical protein